MGIFSLVAGCVALLSFGLTIPLNSAYPGVLGITLAVIALVTGIIARRTRAGMAGLVLGAVGLVVVAAGYLLLTGRTTSSVIMPARSSSEVAAPAPR